MEDFSHIEDQAYAPAKFSRIISAGGSIITDEILLEVFRRIDPLLLEPRPTKVIMAMLERRRGRRPSRGVHSLTWLAKQVAAIDRADIAPSYLVALSKRIASGKGTSDHEGTVQFDRCRFKLDRNMFIRGLFREMRELLADKRDPVNHPILGKLEVPAGMPPQMQAAEMTLRVLERAGHDVISRQRVIAIASMRQ